MIEGDSSLFNKPLLMVAIVAKYIQCVTRLLKFWFQAYQKYNRPHLGSFCEKPESADFCVK